MVIVLVAIVAAVFVISERMGRESRPWELGLDLQGGAHLVYSIDLSKVAAADQSFCRFRLARRHR